MKIEIDFWSARNLIDLLEEQNQSYTHCILNYVGEEKTWRVCIERNEKLIALLCTVSD